MEGQDDILDIKPTSDIFIAVFMSAPKNEPILVAIINAVLTDSGWERIVSATVLNPFNITDYAADKRIILDVRVRDEADHLYNIEIQTYPHTAFEDRILFGWADSYSSQLPRGVDYTELEPVFSIVITEFPIYKKSPNKKVHLVFEAREKNDHDLLLSEHFQVHVLRLYPLFKGHWELLDEVDPDLASWLLFWVHGKKNEVEMSKLAEEHPIVQKALSDPLFKEAVQEFHRFISDPKMREIERQRRLYILEMSLAKKEGKAEGKAEGKTEGQVLAILCVLKARFLTIPMELQNRIFMIHDSARLESLAGQAAICPSLNDFEKLLN